MAADLFRSALVQQTRASLNAIEQALRSEPALGAEAAAVLLERWGDALRLEEPVPKEVRIRAGQIGLAALGEVLRDRMDEVGAWTISAPIDEAADRLGFVLCRRDETESLLQGLTRLMLDRGELPADVDGIDALCDALAGFDTALGQVVDRKYAEAALGIRVALHDEKTWLATLPLPEPTGVADAVQGVDWAGFAADAAVAPSDAIVDRYVRHGALRTYVEGHAARDRDFATELVDIIDHVQQIGEPISLMAAVWRKRHAEQPAAANPLRYRFAADRREAAASTSAFSSELQRYELGPLPGVAAEAALEHRGNELALIVYPERTLKLVVFGGAECAHPEADGNWVVRIPAGDRSAAFHVLVVDDAGNRFEETLNLELR